MKKDDRVKMTTRLDPALAGRVRALRSAAGLEGAQPPEGAFLAVLVRKGLELVEREHGLSPEPTKAAA